MQQTFAADRVDESETRRHDESGSRETGRLVDPHTAVGLTAARAAASGEDVVDARDRPPREISRRGRNGDRRQTGTSRAPASGS